MANTHLLPYFGDVPVMNITEDKVQEFVSHLTRTTYTTPAGNSHPLSAVYIRDLVSILKRIVGKGAREWELTLPSVPFKEQRYFTPDEMVRVIDAARGHWKPFFALLAETGLRCGEACGLHAEDFDVEAQQIIVRRSIHNGREYSPKTQRAYRTVDLSPELRQMLKQHLNDRAEGYVFRTRNGTPFGQENCRRMLHNILRQLGIAKGGLHAFRHGRVSILQASGVPGDLIKEWVGHSSLRTTSRYTHFQPTFRQQEAERVGFLNGPHGPQISHRSESEQQLQMAGG